MLIADGLVALLPSGATLVSGALLAITAIVATASARTHAQVTRCIDFSQLLYLIVSLLTTLRAAPLLDDFFTKMGFASCIVSSLVHAWHNIRRRDSYQLRTADVIKSGFVFPLQLPSTLQWLRNDEHRKQKGVMATAFVCGIGWWIMSYQLTDNALEQQRNEAAQWTQEKETEGEWPLRLPPKRLSYIPSVHVILLAGLQLV